MGIELARLFVRVRGDSSKLGGDMKQAKGKTLKALGGIGRGAASAMGLGVSSAGAAIGVALVKANQAGEDFNRKMNNSLAIMGDVSGAMRDDMKGAALEVAESTQFSGAQAAESFFFLASAGLDAKQSIAALPQVAQFAQAGMFDMATATDLATDAQSAIGLTSKDAQKNLTNLTRVTDVLVKANTLANASVEQFSLALTSKGGAAARAAGKDVEEATAVLAAFADQGTKGQEAGTALNIVLRDLKSKAAENKKEFAQAGIEVFDAQGNMANMADIVGDLEGAMGGLSIEQQNALLGQLGFADKSKIFIQTLLGTSDKIRKYEKDLRSAGGTTREVADKQLTSTQKGMAKLGAAWTELGTTINDGVGDVVGSTLGFFADMLKGMIPIVEEMKFIFRNFSSIAQIAVIDLVLFFTETFPKMQEPIAQLAAFFTGTWAGVKAFFMSIIDTIKGGFMELKNFAVAIGAGISAAFDSIMQGNFTGAAKAGADAFLQTLASQKDVPAKNAFKEFSSAFQEARSETLKNFQEKGGLNAALRDQRDQLTRAIAESEQAIKNAKAGPTQATAEEEEVKAAAEGGTVKKKIEVELSRVGFAELGSSIQDALLDEDNDKKILKAGERTATATEEMARTLKTPRPATVT